MTVDLNKDTLLCMSLSERPSNIGTRFHNYLYEELGLNFVYKAFTTEDVPAAIGGIRALGIRGCGVSMPFKEQVIEHIDVMHDSASAIDSVNTIVNESECCTPTTPTIRRWPICCVTTTSTRACPSLSPAAVAWQKQSSLRCATPDSPTSP